MNQRRLVGIILCVLATTGFTQQPAGGFRPVDIQAMMYLPPVAVVSTITQGYSTLLKIRRGKKTGRPDL